MKKNFNEIKLDLWLIGLLALLGCIIPMVYFNWWIGMSIFTIIYLFIFGVIMVCLTMKDKDQLAQAYREISGITILETRTVVTEELYDENSYHIRDTQELADLSQNDFEIIMNYKDDLRQDLERALNPDALKSEINEKENAPKKKSTAKKEENSNPEAKIPKQISINEILDWKIVKCELTAFDRLIGYPMQEFDHFYLLTPTPGLTAFKHKQNTPLFYQGYNITGNQCYGDLLFIAWILPTIPLFMIYNSPQLVLPLTSVRKELEGITAKTDLILRNKILQMIEQYKHVDKIFDDKMVEKDKQIQLLKIQAEQAELRSNLIQNRQLDMPQYDLDPTYSYFPKWLIIVSLIGNFLLGALALANYMGGN